MREKRADSSPYSSLPLPLSLSLSIGVCLHPREPRSPMSAALPPPFSPPGVAVVQVAAPASLSPSSAASTRRARVAIYTGMAAQELALVVKSVLALPVDAECTGFLVIDAARQSNSSKKKSASRHHHHHARDYSTAAFQRIVPLSLACIAPELLTTVRYACSLCVCMYMCVLSLRSYVCVSTTAKRLRDGARGVPG